jgi:CBS domain containing-hemolysin-like protein
MPDVSLLSVFVLCVGLSALFSAIEPALFAVPRGRLRKLAARGGLLADLFRRLTDAPQRVLAGVLLANTLAGVGAAASSALLLQRWLGEAVSPGILLLVQVVTVTFVLLVFGELAPKTYALARGETATMHLAGFLRVVEPLLRPAAHFLGGLAHAITRWRGARPRLAPATEELASLIDEGRRSGTFPVEEARILTGALHLRRLSAADILIPRADLVAAPADAPVSELVDLLSAAGHSRIPIYERTLDRIVGVVEAADLLPFVLGESARATARDLMRPPVVVPPTRSLEELLLAMQRERLQFAIVVQTGGEALGVVSLEDLVEELVGEIESEIEAPEAAVRLVGEGTAVVRSHVRVSDVNRLLGTRLPSADGSTVEALVERLWDTAPSEGQARRAERGETLTIETMVGGRVWSVRVARAGREAA